ncbi:DNA polymerase-4 [Actinopolyspora mzabensis]|uniref:DNA polymerase IV n=1 Tax=Actinopolyspora mzabensis TaxID=995066 RepID=A0A1G9DNM6_ACTMZ|nr:DNA polymerase IV [Actinopolyspora mzabensis]SDK65410.1 DNA polymerase-4 [Actinopolyspora mzabensis]
MTRWVLHLDMDAFYASVEQLTRPTLRERAVLVGGTGPRGTVAGASYPARRYGARSAMPMSEARRLCRTAVVLPPRFRLYREVSERVFTIVRQLSERFEQVSIDEAFLEPSELTGSAPEVVAEFAESLRARVAAEVGVPASVGAGSGKQLAKIASGMAKPDGSMVVPPDEEKELLAELPVRRLWGIGPIGESKLRRIGVQTIGELAALKLGDVTSLLGQAHGAELHELAHGIDERAVTERAEAKQVSAETTFDTDRTDPSGLAGEIVGMAEAAHRRLVASERAARTVTLKVRDADFSTISRSETLSSATTEREELVAAARRLAGIAVSPGVPVRLVGVSYSGLTVAEQATLFRVPETEENEDPQASPEPSRAPAPAVATGGSQWRQGDDVSHPGWGHGWVQGSGHGRVSVRFETSATGPGRMRTFDTGDHELVAADPLDSLGGTDAPA